jgi:hypothetical protein
MKRKGLFGQELALGFATCVGVPELSGKEESAKGFNAAGIDL